MKIIEVEKQKYELIKDYRDGFELQEFQNCYTDYFEDYDYLVGDIAYNKLRLKGFYDPQNKKVKEINNYKNLKKYLDEDCAVDCRYFILKKLKDEK